VNTFYGGPGRRSPVTRFREGVEQQADALGTFGMAEGRVQARQRRMADDVDGSP
jgi:hypothetical protein